MGAETGMDTERTTIELYSAQSLAVIAAIEKDGRCFSKEAYVKAKYGESQTVFLSAYRFLAAEMQTRVPRPAGAELPYWAFGDPCNLEAPSGAEGRVLRLRVPVAEALFFDMYDWNRVLQCAYMGGDEAEERRFREELAAQGIREMDAALTPFYPALRERIHGSWRRRLLRHHAAVCAGSLAGIGALQAALWQIKKEWILT